MAATSQTSSRRGSGLGLSGYQSPRPPPLATTKSNSLSLPDSPTIVTYQRGRSNSLRVIDDILLRRSNSLRQGLPNIDSARRKSSLEDIGLSHFSTNFANPLKIALNETIGLEVTPPEENSPPVICSNTALLGNPPHLTPPVLSGSIISLSPSVPSSCSSLPQPLNPTLIVPEKEYIDSTTGIPQQTAFPNSTATEHLRGTIV